MSCFPVILFCRVNKEISNAGAQCRKTAGSFRSFSAIHDYKNLSKRKKKLNKNYNRTVEKLITSN